MFRESKLILYAQALPKTLYFNLKYFKLRDALKLPVLVSHRVYLMETKGAVEIAGPIRPGMIKIGFGDVGIFDKQRSRSVWQVTGKVVFYGRADLGHGSKLSVSGLLTIGPDFMITAESQIICKHRMVIGRDVLISWDCLVMDSDLHQIIDWAGNQINENRTVVIGDHVWLGCRVLLLKGTRLGNNLVIAANSCLSGEFMVDSAVIGGTPPVVLKSGITWRH